MKGEDLIKAIEKQYAKSRDTYFSYAWREKVDEWLDSESKYARLVDWINERIEESQANIDLFSPADRPKWYTIGFFETYRKACGEIAMLIHLKWLLLDNRCTTKMRANIEYTICKIFHIHYNDIMKCYCVGCGNSAIEQRNEDGSIN